MTFMLVSCIHSRNAAVSSWLRTNRMFLSAALFSLLSGAEASVDVWATRFVCVIIYSLSLFPLHFATLLLSICQLLDFFFGNISRFSWISAVSTQVLFMHKMKMCIKTDGWKPAYCKQTTFLLYMQYFGMLTSTYTTISFNKYVINHPTPTHKLLNIVAIAMQDPECAAFSL